MRSGARLSVADAVLLGLVEGLTEFLPVSSTGHLAVAQDLLDIGTGTRGQAAADAYVIVVQGGAVTAIGWLYRSRLLGAGTAILGRRDDSARDLGWALVAAFVPAGVAGLLLGDVIKDRLFGIWPIVLAWAVGGVVILVWSLREKRGNKLLEDVRICDGVLIGGAQALALWPGVSRSLVTILAALACGLAMKAAVEFSFLLGFLTLGAATAYEMINSGSLISEELGLLAPVVGFIAALGSAAVAVAWMLRFLEHKGLAVFGWYRLVVAALVAGLTTTTLL